MREQGRPAELAHPKSTTILLESDEWTKFKQLVLMQDTTVSKEIRKFIRTYIRKYEVEGQAPLDNFQDSELKVFPTLGDENPRSKLEKMSDEDVATILRYAYQWYVESDAHLYRAGYRKSDLQNVKTGGWPVLVAAVRGESKGRKIGHPQKLRF